MSEWLADSCGVENPGIPLLIFICSSLILSSRISIPAYTFSLHTSPFCPNPQHDQASISHGNKLQLKPPRFPTTPHRIPPLPPPPLRTPGLDLEPHLAPTPTHLAASYNLSHHQAGADEPSRLLRSRKVPESFNRALLHLVLQSASPPSRLASHAPARSFNL